MTITRRWTNRLLGLLIVAAGAADEIHARHLCVFGVTVIVFGWIVLWDVGAPKS